MININELLCHFGVSKWDDGVEDDHYYFEKLAGCNIKKIKSMNDHCCYDE